MVILGATALLASCNQGGVNKNAKLKTDLDSVSYAYGIFLVGQFKNLEQHMKKDLDLEFNREVFIRGVYDGVDSSNLLIKEKEVGKILDSYFRKKQSEVLNKKKEDGKKFLEENKKKEGVVTTESGLQYQVIKKGKGKNAQKGQIAVLNYTGTLINGKKFDSSLDKGRKPLEVAVAEGHVIKGWDEALQLMNVGTKLKLFIPSELAYGDRARGADIPAGSVLIFDVELLELKNAKK